MIKNFNHTTVWDENVDQVKHGNLVANLIEMVRWSDLFLRDAGQKCLVI